MPRSHSHQHQHSSNKKYHQHHHRAGNVFLYPTLNRGVSCGERTLVQGQQGNGTPKRNNVTHCPLTPPIFPLPPPGTPPHHHHIIAATQMAPPRYLLSPPHPHRVTNGLIPCLRYERIGNPNLKVFRLRLPPDMISLLDDIVSHAESYVSELPGGWKTELYSLTKQDYAVKDIPGMTQRIRPIHEYICKAIQILFGCRKVAVDKNQPHILKYEMDHTGVELHHDRCDVTANLALSRSCDYQGGGTFFPDIGKVVRIDQGEFLLHPGSLVHGGMDITAGERYLMVTFAHLK